MIRNSFQERKGKKGKERKETKERKGKKGKAPFLHTMYLVDPLGYARGDVAEVTIKSI